MKLTPFELAYVLFLIHLIMLIGSPIYLLKGQRDANAKVSGYYTVEIVIKRLFVIAVIWFLFYQILITINDYTPYKVLSYWHTLWSMALSPSNSDNVSAIIPP